MVSFFPMALPSSVPLQTVYRQEARGTLIGRFRGWYNPYICVRRPSTRLPAGPERKGEAMALYILLSTLTDEGRKTVKSKPERIKEVNKEIEGMGAKVLGQYAVLGMYDFVNVVEA